MSCQSIWTTLPPSMDNVVSAYGQAVRISRGIAENGS
jgi:hypothetical protein